MQIVNSTFTIMTATLIVILSVSQAPGAEPERIEVSDVALSKNGQLSGIIVDQAGKIIRGQEVVVLHNRRVVARIVSDKHGEFSIRGLRGGIHTVKTNSSTQLCRFWVAKTSPPSAINRLLLVTSQRTVRGQYGQSSGFLGSALFGTSTLMAAGGIASGVVGAVAGFNSGLDNDSLGHLSRVELVDLSGNIIGLADAGRTHRPSELLFVGPDGEVRTYVLNEQSVYVEVPSPASP